jgi:hypothetical protein
MSVYEAVFVYIDILEQLLKGRVLFRRDVLEEYLHCLGLEPTWGVVGLHPADYVEHVSLRWLMLDLSKPTMLQR